MANRVLHSVPAIALIVGTVLAGSPLSAQDPTGDQTGPPAPPQDETPLCLECHGFPDMFVGLENEESYVVDPEAFTESVHGVAGTPCVDCHLDMEMFPHDGEAAPVDCGMCHNDQAVQHDRSLHGQALQRGDPTAPSCADCHGRHDILNSSDQRSATRVLNIPMLCGHCHHEGSEVSRSHDISQEHILQNYSLSIHGEGLFQQGLTVTAVCTSCHTSHDILPHTDERSSIHHDRVAETCMACHGQIEQVHRQVIEGELWEAEDNLVPACVDCHTPHEIRRVFYETGAANANCLNCHRDPEIVSELDGLERSLFVDELTYLASAHSSVACAQCHAEVSSAITRPCAAIQTRVDCGSCHEAQVDEYDISVHGTMAAAGDPDAPICLDCHENHTTQTSRSPTSPTFPENVPALCGQCHARGSEAAQRMHDGGFPVEHYPLSIHGTGLFESGLTVTATCSSCHSAHMTLPQSDPRSTLNDANIASTCGTCHNGIAEQLRNSIHWPANVELDEGRMLPTCEDCHTSHTISRTDRDDFRMSMMNQCGRCHEEQAETFFETIHGKVSQLGDVGAAKCYDCHGTHGVLPSDDPNSMLGRRHVVETCGQCHQGSNARFTGYLTHATHHDAEKYPFLFWAFWFMTALLAGTMFFALLHTGAWLFRLYRSPDLRTRYHAKPGEKVYQRFTREQRAMHLMMILSFFTLALTGMMLKFSYMGWAQWVAGVIGGFQTTGFLHRFAALILIGDFGYHLIKVVQHKRTTGLTWWKFLTNENSLMPHPRDLREFKASVKWFLGRGPRPEYGRFTYWEKFDYFAVFWGMLIIGTTGLMLWFPETFTIILPGWTVNVATILHSDEALLAVAFIFTIHFFNTHFRPDKFPMDPVIFTGRVPLEELKRDKAREYQKLVENGDLEKHLVEQSDRRFDGLIRIFAFSALGVGLTLIGLIIYSMLSAML